MLEPLTRLQWVLVGRVQQQEIHLHHLRRHQEATLFSQALPLLAVVALVLKTHLPQNTTAKQVVLVAVPHK